jgi:putative thiamine transport system substrate-binding protein
MRPILAALLPALLATPAAADWQQVLDAARGQTVYWNAWGGDPRTNAFIEWAGERTEELYGVSIEHVKLSDTGEAVARVVAEKAAGKTEGGGIDLIWINGPNFLAMKEQDLLHGPFVADLPNARYLDLTAGSAAATDFTVPTDGFESPWRLARFIFAYDTARVDEPPFTTAGFVDWAAANPGRFTHPVPANFMGATFLKQALIGLLPDPSRSSRSPRRTRRSPRSRRRSGAGTTRCARICGRRGGRSRKTNRLQQQMLNDGEVDFAMYFDPAAPAAAISQGLLPETVRVLVPDGGTIGNVSFVAITWNAANRDGAMVVANFLLDPATQAEMQNIEVLGSFSVLDPAKLSAEEAALFDALPSSPALPEPRGTRPHARRAASELDDPDRRGVGDALHRMNGRRPAPPPRGADGRRAGRDRPGGVRALGDGEGRLRDSARHRGGPPVA